MGWQDKIIDRLWDKGEKYLSANWRKTLNPELAYYSFLFGFFWILGGAALLFISLLLGGSALTKVPASITSTNHLTTSTSSPVPRQLSPEEKRDLRNAVRAIEQINGSLGVAIVSKIKSFPFSFTETFGRYMDATGSMAAPANVDDLVKKLEALRKDCEDFQRELFEDEKSPTKQYVAYDSELKKILEPETIIPILANIKNRINEILKPGLGTFSLRYKIFPKTYHYIESNQGFHNSVPLLDDYRKSEISTNHALYEQIKSKVEELPAAGEDINVWIQEVTRRGSSKRQEIDNN